MAWINVPQASGAQRAAKARARASAGDDRGWYQIRNAASPDEAELMIYDEVGGFFGATADQFVDDLKAVTAPSLRVRVNSPGGSVFEGLAIANALRSHPANVTVQVDGLAASIASVIAMAGDQLVMMPNSMLMIHEASGLCMGDAAEMQKMGEVLDLISDNIADVYAAKAGGTRDEWRGTMRAETWYLPEDAVKAGLADQAVDAKRTAPDEEEPEMRAAWDLTAYGYNGPKQPERPKPGPPPVKAQAEDPAPEPTLVVSIADVLDEETVQRLREAVRERGAEAAAAGFAGAIATTADVSAEPVGTGQQAEANAAGSGPSPVDPEPAAPTEPEAQSDPWADAFAHLTTPDPDPWAAAFAQLTTGPASSSATES